MGRNNPFRRARVAEEKNYELDISEAEADPEFAALSGLGLENLARILSKVVTEGERTQSEDVDYRGPSNYYWHYTVMGVPMELHFYVRSPSRICLRRRDGEWAIAFSSAANKFAYPKRKFVRLNVNGAIIPEHADDLRRRVNLPPKVGERSIAAFSFKRKGNKNAYKKDMTMIRLAI